VTPPTEHDARVTAEVARRAIRRLDILEWVFLGGAVGLATLGGGAIAWLFQSGGVYFRVTWLVSSLLLLVVPGVIVMTTLRRAERARTLGDRGHRDEDDG